MSTDHQPPGYPTVTPFMIVEGADILIAFLETTLGATKKEYMTGSDGSVKHAEMRIGDSLVMIADARLPETKANQTMLYVYVPNADTAYARALEAGATSIREPHDEYYGDRSCAVLDRFGNQWWLATHAEDVSPEEAERRFKETES